MEKNELTFDPAGRTLVLASASPRRRELLSSLGLPFEVRVSDADESAPFGTPPRDAAMLASKRKAAAVAALSRPEEIVIAADTVVDLAGSALGKPKDKEDAVRMLLSLSGRTHYVHTAVTVAVGNRFLTDADTTSVTFRAFGTEEARAYVATGEPMDKAGAYGIQGLGGALVSSTDGELDTVVGLPCRLLDRLLREINE